MVVLKSAMKWDKMKNWNDNNRASRVACPAGAGRSACLRGCRQLFLLIIALWLPVVIQADNVSYSDVIREHLSLESPDVPQAKPHPETGEVDTSYTELALTLAMEAEAIAPKPDIDPLSELKSTPVNWLVLSFAAVIVVGLASRKLVLKRLVAINQRFNPWSDDPESEVDFFSKVRAEDEAFGQFLAHLKIGPSVSPVTSSADSNIPVKPDYVLSEFFAKTAGLLAKQRSLLQEIGSAVDAARQRKLVDLGGEMQLFKEMAGAAGLLPAWQLAAALEGLLKQLSDKAGNVTRSTLRTVGGGVDLLGELCQPGVRKDLLSNPPLKFLAVDDDMISRTAVSMSLKKALTAPDLAENGVTALGFTVKHTYDVIFLDVQMDGMDGFELCSKIHESATNKDTPVVFVTSLSDLEARAQSVLSGGSDLLGKPFLTFEITVKALTLGLGRRLRATPKTFTGTNPSPEAEILQASLAAVNAAAAPQTLSQVDRQAAVVHPNALELAVDSNDLATDNLEHAYLKRTATQLGPLHEKLRQISDTSDENTRQEVLADLYLGLHALAPEKDSGVNHPATRVSNALEGLIKKLLEKPENWTSSALASITNALVLMRDLCATSESSGLESTTSIRLLVVDDDLISRRAIAGALQTAFPKPESVESGEAALTAATAKPYDLIFMDVQMPGMDGFTACTKIRQTAANGSTPVVFVTGQADAKARAQATASGGNDLIAKPFLTSELMVTALTFVLRGRLQKLFPPAAPAATPPMVKPKSARESRRARKRARRHQVIA